MGLVRSLVQYNLNHASRRSNIIKFRFSKWSLLLILAILAILLFSVTLVSQAVEPIEGQWLSLENPQPDGYFYVKNHAPFTIFLAHGGGSYSEGIGAGQTRSRPMSYGSVLDALANGFCRDNPGSEIVVNIGATEHEGQPASNVSAVAYPCSAWAGASNSGGGTTSPTTTGNANTGGNSGVTCVTPNSSNMNVRSGAGTSFSIVGSLPARSCYPYLGQATNGWYHIQIPGGPTGYVSNDYTYIQNGESSSSSSSTSSNSGLAEVCGSVEYTTSGIPVINRPGWISLATIETIYIETSQHVIPVLTKSDTFWNAPIAFAFGTQSQISAFDPDSVAGLAGLFKVDLGAGCVRESAQPLGETYRVALVSGSVSTTWHEMAHLRGAGHGAQCRPGTSNRNTGIPLAGDACAWGNSSTRTQILNS